MFHFIYYFFKLLSSKSVFIHRSVIKQEVLANPWEYTQLTPKLRFLTYSKLQFPQYLKVHFILL